MITALIKNPLARAIIGVVTFCFLGLQVVCLCPEEVRAAAKDDLKTIKYKYYFRGNYERAITDLESFLERRGLDRVLAVEAREYLAASLILSGATAEGKAQYKKLLKDNPAYVGPDPSVFKSMIVSTFNEAKAEYASTVIRTVPDTAMPDATTSPVGDSEPGKPIYKKWWFYATMGAVLLVVVGAAAGGGEEAARETGSVKVGVDIP